MNTKLTQFITSKIIVITASVFVAGCSNVATFQQINENDKKNLRGVPWAYQYRDFVNKHPQAAINKPVDLCEQRDVLYVKMHNHSSLSSAYFEDAVMITLEDNELFHKIVTREPTIYINVDPYSPLQLEDGRLWYDTDDPLTVGQIRRMYPKSGTLILEVRLQEFAKNDPIAISLALIDPTDGATVFYWRDTRNVWYRSADMPTVAMVDNFNAWMDDVAEMCEESEEKVEIEVAGDEVELEIEGKHLEVEVEVENHEAEHHKVEQHKVEKPKKETEEHKKSVKKSHSVLTPTIVK